MIPLGEVRRIAESLGLLWNGVWQVDETKFMKALDMAYELGWDANND